MTTAQPTLRPAAQTPVHACLYCLGNDIGAVLHTHSVAATALSRATDGSLQVCGFEMRKAIQLFNKPEGRLANFTGDHIAGHFTMRDI